jgi:hypothetical protein
VQVIKGANINSLLFAGISFRLFIIFLDLLFFSGKIHVYVKENGQVNGRSSQIILSGAVVNEQPLT